MARQLEIVYQNDTCSDGAGTVSADSTSEQAMKVSGDNTCAPQTDKSGAIKGWLLDSKVSGLTCTTCSGGYLRFTAIGGGAIVGSEIEVGADAFPTAYTSGVKRGLITRMDGTKYIVKMYDV